MTTRMWNKRFQSLMVATMLVLVLVTGAFAASKTVNITNGSGPVASGSISATNGASYSGSNNASSGHRLYITLQSSNGSGWQDQKVSLMDIGSTASGSSTKSGTLIWRVLLNPEYAYTDCIGSGKVSNR